MNKRKGTKVLAAIMALVLWVGAIPFTGLTAFAAEDENYFLREVDQSTMNDWEELFLESDADGVQFTTENAGGVWTDKSVFLPTNIPAELTNAKLVNEDTNETTSLRVADTGDNYLVALSAIASNKEIVGYSTIPTDTVFVLDLSSSMRTNGDNRTSAIDNLVDATNRSITDLLALNKNNRIAVVLYAGNVNGSFSSADGTTEVILPLDTYEATTTSNGVGQYLQATSYSGNANWAVQIRSGVTNSSGRTMSGSKNTATGTYMQDGIYEAMKVLLDAEPTVQSGIQAGVVRKPIMLLMTDGEPTLANNDYDGNDALTNLGNSVMYNYDGSNSSYNHRDSIAFMTMLTAAFSKKQVERHYGTSALYYTLAYGQQVNTMDEAISVMNPEQTSNIINRTFWDPFLSGSNVEVYRSGDNRLSVRNSTDENKRITAEDKLYVDEFFPANTDAQLATAFGAIVEEIRLQSKYYPTYVERDHDHDGYITFTDKIGGYMEVTSIKGFVIGDHFFSGAALSRGFTEEDSIFGTIENPDPRGDNLVWSVKERLGIESTTVARQLLQSAYDHGQLSYTSDSIFSNYIGWYSDEKGNYLDFWHEGVDETDVPDNATYIIKSYGFLGETDKAHGVSDTDMLYASVRVSTELVDYDGDGITGETMLTWQIPASLIPTITYNVDVNVDSEGNITGVRNVTLENENVSPIRLLYEIALRSDIKEWNITQKVSAAYRDSVANKDAGYVFYTNQWMKGEPADSTRNTYSHFEPSVENERYYYTENAIIYTDTNGTEYSGGRNTPPSVQETYYRQFNVYEKLNNGTYRMHTHYEEISEEAISELTAANNYVNDNWVIRKGVIHRYLAPFSAEKANNETETNDYSEYPSVVRDAANDHYYSYSTLGNNGKLTITPATGIKVTKTLEEAVPGAVNNFEFEISGNNTSSATIIRLDAAGNEASRQTLAFTNNKATFSLAADETIYIIGLNPGTEYTISEKAHAAYNVVSVTVDDVDSTSGTAVFTPVSQKIHTAEFVNGPKGYGNLYITKEITSDHTVPTSIMNQTFEIEIATNVTGSYQVLYTNAAGQQEETATVVGGFLKRANGENFKIPVDVTYEIVGLPEGAEVTVTEKLTTAQDVYFDVAHKSRDHSGATQEPDGTVIITRNANSTVIVTNEYEPKSVTVDLDIAGTKNFNVGNNTLSEVEFEFIVEQRVENDWVPITGKTATVKTNGTQKTFTIDNVLEDVQKFTYTTVGDYAYQVREVIPAAEDRIDGVTYDRTLYTFTVHVTDNGGQLVATVRDHSGATITDSSYEVVFNNSYHTAPVSIDIEKTVTNTAATAEITPAGFEFTATEATIVNNEWVASSQPEDTFKEVTDGAGEARFAFTYATEGTYYYIVKETVPEGATKVTDGTYAGKYMLNGMVYDPTVYYVTVTVTGSGADIQATVTTTTSPNVGTAADTTTLVFTNIYDPEDVEVDLNENVEAQIPATVLKHLEGRDLVAGEFTFYVKNNNEAYDANKANNLVGTNDADGNVDFDKKLKFDKVGRYEFDIVEVAPTDKKGVTYDNTIYDLVVEVSDNNEGKLVAHVYFEDSINDQVTFHNTYKAADTTIRLGGRKRIVGKELMNAEFQFTLKEVTDATGATLVENGVSLTAENVPDNNGDKTAGFTFPAIPYTSDDAGETFYYLIEEVNAGKTINGVLHDTRKYVVAVEVTDTLAGTLEIATTIAENNNPVEEIWFENIYTPESVTVNLVALKELEGRDLLDKEFSFHIKQTESDFATTFTDGVSETVKNNENGVITFSEMEFDATGNYYFVVEEVAGNAGGITYDNTKYHVIVTVEDDGLGKHTAKTAITMLRVSNEEGQNTIVETPTSSMHFVNYYNAKAATVQFNASKVLKGRDLEAAEFRFVLKDEEGKELQNVANDKDGKVYFDAIEYTEVGTYKYVVAEEAGQIKDVTYDKTEYALVVEVTDDGKGNLVATTSIVKKGEKDQEVEEIVFENTYKAPKVEEDTTPEDTKESPKTGDSASTVMWAGLATVSVVTCAVLSAKRRKEEEEN